MSGKRCKAIRREFRQKTGLSPEGAAIRLEGRKGRWMGKVFTFFQMVVEQPSEWRRLKKAYLLKRRGRA